MNITELAGWSAVGLYVLVALYVLAEMLATKHVHTRSVAAKARIVLEVAAWPIGVLPWRELPSWLRRLSTRVQDAWNALPTRYAEVGS